MEVNDDLSTSITRLDEPPLNNSHRVIDLDKSPGRVIDLDNSSGGVIEVEFDNSM